MHEVAIIDQTVELTRSHTSRTFRHVGDCVSHSSRKASQGLHPVRRQVRTVVSGHGTSLPPRVKSEEPVLPKVELASPVSMLRFLSSRYGDR